ncbi:hypothetical protein E5843_04560 [Luteimonas yindakuii]|uniref:hypothetical protein n=1 Tax=Luteimonas yindakuii TaxID=2565782 RepID=UPI0010A3105B|nr:hypothetical protein [Luteimonas yindakuii]QCO67238.1 hypothetical protein E5843_04560 [Luteimonas yindakuii]
MFDSITNSLSSLAGNFAGNLVNNILDMAPGLVTNLMSVAANTVLPGSGLLVQALAGPIVDAGFDAVESLARDALLPALSDTLDVAGQQDFGDFGNFATGLANTFMDGVQSGWVG